MHTICYPRDSLSSIQQNQMLLFTMFSLSVLDEVHIFQCRNSFYFCNEELPQERFILDLWGNVIPVYQTTICFHLFNFYTATLISNGTLSKNIFFLCILVDHDIWFYVFGCNFFPGKIAPVLISFSWWSSCGEWVKPRNKGIGIKDL